MTHATNWELNSSMCWDKVINISCLSPGVPKAGMDLYHILSLSHKGNATSAKRPTYRKAPICDLQLISPGGIQLALRETWPSHLAGSTYTRTFPRDTAISYTAIYKLNTVNCNVSRATWSICPSIHQSSQVILIHHWQVLGSYTKQALHPRQGSN